ncbi:MAG TPA: PDZ domain-containing protein [Syntrophomonadaceae bacterium]|nr:PDZ domain-containing protein [Syntrophomonadaceae bacterium]
MDLLWTSAAIIGQVLANAFASPYFILLLLGLLSGIAWQYQRNARTSGDLLEGIWGVSLRASLISTTLGLLGGVIGSLLLLWTGVDLSRIAIIPLWITALFLMMINPRYLCFAYSGGLLALSSLLLGYPRLSIPDLMALIAILHMLESLLIFLDGPVYPVPVYVQRGEGVCGGFNLQKFWPVILAVIMQGQNVFGGPVPVLGSSAITASIATVLAVLGYGEISTAYTPKQKSRRSSLRLFTFSAILLLLAYLSARWSDFQYLAALFSPLGHEFIIGMGMREERRKPPLFALQSDGIMILSLQSGSPAARAGLRSGDIILELGGCPVFNNEDMKLALARHRIPVRVDGLRDKKQFSCSLGFSPQSLRGIILVPDQHCHRVLLLPNDSLLEASLRPLRRIKSAIKKSIFR